MSIKCYVSAIAAASLVAGCATKSADIAPAYTSPVLYQNWTCQQLAEEAQRIVSEVNKLSGVQDKQATNDAVATAVAVVVFWPAAFLVGGDKGNAAQLAQLKGQYNAVYEETVRKNCNNIRFENGPPPRKS